MVLRGSCGMFAAHAFAPYLLHAEADYQSKGADWLALVQIWSWLNGSFSGLFKCSFPNVNS